MLRSRLRRWYKPLTAAVLALMTLGGRPQPAAAQTRVTPQTSVATLAPAGTACTGSQQSFPVPDFGQTEHTATLNYSSNPVNSQMYFYTLMAGISVVISDTVMRPSVAGTVTTAGYYAQLFVGVVCTPGATFRLDYSGASATPFVVAGNLLFSQIDKTVYNGTSAGSSPSSQSLDTPYGSSAGYLSVVFVGVSHPTGSTVYMQCQDAGAVIVPSFTYLLQPTGTAQTFPVPALPCPSVAVQYVSGGASTDIATVDYIFTPPGFPLASTSAAWSKTNITTAATTAVKTTGGVLQNVFVNTSTAGTIKLYDIGGAGCNLTPGSGLFATITTLASSQPVVLPYNVLIYNGICVVTSATTDVTVMYQ